MGGQVKRGIESQRPTFTFEAWPRRRKSAYLGGFCNSILQTSRQCVSIRIELRLTGLPGNPYEGHTLAEIIPDVEKTIGNGNERILADAECRGHNAPLSHGFKVYNSRRERRMTPTIKRDMRGRARRGSSISHL